MTVYVRSGPLRHRVTIQKRPSDEEQAFDAAGQPADTWVEVAKAWASVEPLRARELFSAREAGQEATHRVRMRWNPAMRSGGEWQIGRMLHEGRVLVPEGSPMDVEERGRMVEVLCTERTDPE